MEQSFNSETLNNFGNKSNLGAEMNLRKEQKMLLQESIEVAQYETMSVSDIIKRFNFRIFLKEEIQLNLSQVYVHNKSHKFYLGKHTFLGPLSIIILNDVAHKKTAVGNLLEKLTIMNEVNSKYLLKLKGIVNIDNKQVYLIFDPVLTSYRNKVKARPADLSFKYMTLFYLIELVHHCHAKSLGLETIRPSNLLYNSIEELRIIYKLIAEFLEFNQNYDGRPERIEEEFRYDRYRTPENAIDNDVNILQDIWTVGCLMVEIFSAKEVWQGSSELEMMRDLKKYYVPNIHKDIPKQMWGIICECLNPFKETRHDAKELLEKYVKLMLKMKIPELQNDLEMYAADYEVSKINLTSLEEEDPKAIRKCRLHTRNEAFLFCAQCSEIICESCKKTIHSEHAEKNLVFEYLDLINIARSRIHSYKEKFGKYIISANVPKKEIYDSVLKINEEHIEQLYLNQKKKIEEQFSYLFQIMQNLKNIELEHLTANRVFFQNLFGKILENYNQMQSDIDEEKEKIFLRFQDLDQIQKEELLKGVARDENLLNFKKKNIIKCVSNFHKESSQIERLKRYFEIFIEKYKENKINEIVKVVEKKNETIKKKYEETDLNDNLKILIQEFEQTALLSARSYFNSQSRELFISIVNTNKIFSYHLDSQKYFVTEVDFEGMPLNRFPNYSRSLVINGNLLINGGFDEDNKVTLPFFFFYDKLNKNISRLSDMLYGHSAHSIIYIPPHFVVVVSGSGTVKCEKFDMENNSWTELPDINVTRQNATLFYYNKQYLYTFGGAFWDDTQKSFVYVESVERIDLGFGSVEGGERWEKVITFNLGNVNLKKSVLSVLSYNANQILLVGGSINYNTYSDEVILFDFDKNEFSEKEGIVLPKKTCFPNKTFIHSGNHAYQMDNDGSVHEFDFLTEKFTIVKENTVLKSTR